MEIDNKIFQNNVKNFLEKLWKVKLTEKRINIGGVQKKFDFVSEDQNYIGEAKYYKNLNTPSVKFSTIAECVWLLEKTKAEKKFLIFGNDAEVPKRWLNRFGFITNVEFYFYNMKNLELLNRGFFEKRNKIIRKEKNPLLDLSVWNDKDFEYLKDLRRDMNKWKMKY